MDQGNQAFIPLVFLRNGVRGILLVTLGSLLIIMIFPTLLPESAREYNYILSPIIFILVLTLFVIKSRENNNLLRRTQKDPSWTYTGSDYDNYYIEMEWFMTERNNGHHGLNHEVIHGSPHEAGFHHGSIHNCGSLDNEEYSHTDCGYDFF